MKAYNYFNKKNISKNYLNLYSKKKDFNQYPANDLRLKIVLSILNKNKPKKILDAGCGSGMPLIIIKKKGFDISGYDKSSNMVKEAKKNLKKHNLNENLIFCNDFENPKKIKRNYYDCILGLGAFYYSKNIFKTLNKQTQILRKNGKIIFSLRNKLFNISTFNNYTKIFFKELFNEDRLIGKEKLLLKKILRNFDLRNKKKNIDDVGVFSTSHNPLNIDDELLKKVGLKKENIYFYHYHYLPPYFENISKKKFYLNSLKIEDPNDWRGNFLASGFILECKKSK